MAFASLAKSGGNLGTLVRTPLIKFKKALEVLASHEKTEYHKDAYARMVAFRDYMSKKRESIAMQLNTVYA